MTNQMKRFDDRPLKWCTDCLLADEKYRFDYGVTAPMSEICPHCKVYKGDVE